MQRFIVTLLVALMTACVAPCVLSQPQVAIKPVPVPLPNVVVLVDGKVLEAETIKLVRGQQIMVWLRDLERLGWGTIQAGQPGQFILKAKNVTLTFIKGQSVALVNSLAVQLPIDTYITDGRLMVPLSFVAKSLGYRYECAQKLVASVITTPAASTPGRNAIQGKVTYNGKPVKGIKVRAADSEYKGVPGALTTSDSEGSYRIGGLPDGTYMAYVYTEDNPGYINRASQGVTLSDGKTALVQPITLIRYVQPVSPKPGSTASVKKGQVGFAWSSCEGAANYRLVIKRNESSETLFQSTSAKPKTDVPSGKFTPDVTYEAKVTALDAAGRALGSSAGQTPWTFTVERPQ